MRFYIIGFLTIFLVSNSYSMGLKTVIFKTKKLNKREVSSTSYMDEADRDYFLDLYFHDHITNWDNFERDLLYKDILFFSSTEIINKYSFITSKKLKLITAAFRELDIHKAHFRAKDLSVLSGKNTFFTN